MIRNSKNKTMLILAAAAGATVFSLLSPVGAFAQTTLVTICFRSRTVQVPSYLLNTYITQGGRPGPCTVTPP